MTLWVLNDEVLEGCTHVNPVDHVVSEMLLSWLFQSSRSLRGTKPGSVRDPVEPRRSTPKSMATVHADHAGEGDAEDIGAT